MDCFASLAMTMWAQRDPFVNPAYGLICLAGKRNIMRRPATNWHDGQISQNLSSPSRKNILLSFSRKSVA
jgi:hypothetical protein